MTRAEVVAASITAASNAHRFARIGSAGDGGYVVPVDLPLPELAISIGVGPDNSADLALASRGVRVVEFDHTVDEAPGSHDRLRFHKLGVGSVTESEARSDILTLDEIKDVAGHGDEIWLLMDVEGAEWAVLTDAPDLRAFSVICIELHGLAALIVDGGDRLASLERLASDHVVIACHHNDLTPMYRIAGISIPDTVELTLVRSDLFSPGVGAVPSSLLRPNDPVIRAAQ